MDKYRGLLHEHRRSLLENEEENSHSVNSAKAIGDGNMLEAEFDNDEMDDNKRFDDIDDEFSEPLFDEEEPKKEHRDFTGEGKDLIQTKRTLPHIVFSFLGVVGGFPKPPPKLFKKNLDKNQQ